jgi:hypothetical protein
MVHRQTKKLLKKKLLIGSRGPCKFAAREPNAHGCVSAEKECFVSKNNHPSKEERHEVSTSPVLSLVERGTELLERCRKLSERLADATRELVRDRSSSRP